MPLEQIIAACFVERTSHGFIYKLPKNFPAFTGHFEGHPLLPGICQISICVDAASRLLDRTVQLSYLKQAKFLSPILPEAILEVRFTPRAQANYLAEICDVQKGTKVGHLVAQFTESL